MSALLEIQSLLLLSRRWCGVCVYFCPFDWEPTEKGKKSKKGFTVYLVFGGERIFTVELIAIN